MKTFKQLLVELCACREAREWASDMTVEQVVEKCHRGDWLLWLAQKVRIKKRHLAFACGYFMASYLHLINDETFKEYLENSYREGNIDFEVLKTAYYSAHKKRDTIYNNMYAKYDVNVDVESAYAFAAAATNDSYNINKSQRKTADIFRKYIGHLIIEKVNELLK